MKEKRTFILYSVGKSPRALRLGNLVFEDCYNPTTTKHYIHRELSDNNILEHASRDPLGPTAVNITSSYDGGLGVEGGGLAGFDFSLARENERILVAQKGERIEMLRSDKFFATEIAVRGSEAESVLRLWLSAPTLKSLLDQWGLKHPKIWLLTGMYVFEDARSCQIRSWNPQVSLHASSELIGAVSGCPVGGSLNFSRTQSIQITNTFPGRMVWAAQYQLVDARYLKASAEAAAPDFVATIGLWPDTFSKGQLRGSETEYTVANIRVSLPEVQQQSKFDGPASANKNDAENRSAIGGSKSHKPEESEDAKSALDDHSAEYLTDLFAALDMYEGYYGADEDDDNDHEIEERER